MIPGLALPDYAVLGIFLAAMVALGAWAGRRQTTTDEFFLAGRSLSWGPLAPSLAVAGGLAVYYCSAPNEAYWVGLKFLLVPALVWAALPIVFWCVIPLYGTLELDSVFEYLELRYSPATRAAAAFVYLIWQVLWLGGVLVLPCMALRLGTGLNFTVLVLLIAMGGVAAWYTYLGGMKATVWTDVAQLVLMAVALGVLIFAVTSHFKQGEGPARVWEVAQQLGRTNIVEPTHGWSPDWAQSAAQWSVWSAGWSIWSVVPYLAILPMFYFVADQTTLQRFFAARDDQDMILSYLVGSALFCLLVPVAMYVGVGLLAVYHDDAQAMIPPNWVVHSARDPDSGEPLIGPDTVIDENTIADLIARGAILDPNTNRPFADQDELIYGGNQVNIDRLATRAVRRHGGERRLRAGGDELFAHFVKRHLPFVGLAGVILAALAAAVMATIDSAINSLATVVVVDFHRRFGWAEMWLAPMRQGSRRVGRNGRTPAGPPDGAGPRRGGGPGVAGGRRVGRRARLPAGRDEPLRRALVGDLPAGTVHPSHHGPGGAGRHGVGHADRRVGDVRTPVGRGCPAGGDVAVREAAGAVLAAELRPGGHVGRGIPLQLRPRPAEIARRTERPGGRTGPVGRPAGNRRGEERGTLLDRDRRRATSAAKPLAMSANRYERKIAWQRPGQVIP